MASMDSFLPCFSENCTGTSQNCPCLPDEQKLYMGISCWVDILYQLTSVDLTSNLLL